MAPIRSVLWIGPGEHFAADVVAEAPALDVVWEPDLGAALALPLARFDAVVLDALRAEEALHALSRLRRRDAAPPVLVRLPGREAPRCDDLLAAGAGRVTVHTRGETSDSLVETVEALVGSTAPDAPPDRPPRVGVVGDAPAMREVFSLVACASRSRATVLLSGETGTGKELLARAIHDGGPRHRRPFVAVNCAAFPETLLESELFGHVRGSFTGAARDRRGLFEEAEGGTLFLDEVGETSAPLQAKLLRVLQEREVRPLGANTARAVDVRVVAATNRDLVRETRSGRFREDLYYRLAVFPIHVPPLRARPADVLPLARHFLARHGEHEGVPGVRLSPEAARLLRSHPWPGNVRELENEVQRALALADPNATLTPEHFSPRLGDPDPATGPAAPEEEDPLALGPTLEATLERLEARLIRRALADHGHRRAATARRLGITREGLYKKMKRLGIE